MYSWNITKLKAPAIWTYFYLYVILDVFSRYAVGWTVQHRENSVVAKDLIAQVCEQQHIAPHQPTVHADRGSSMTSKPVAFLLAAATKLGPTRMAARSDLSCRSRWPPPSRSTSDQRECRKGRAPVARAPREKGLSPARRRTTGWGRCAHTG